MVILRARVRNSGFLADRFQPSGLSVTPLYKENCDEVEFCRSKYLFEPPSGVEVLSEDVLDGG